TTAPWTMSCAWVLRTSSVSNRRSTAIPPSGRRRISRFTMRRTVRRRGCQLIESAIADLLRVRRAGAECRRCPRSARRRRRLPGSRAVPELVADAVHRHDRLAAGVEELRAQAPHVAVDRPARDVRLVLVGLAHELLTRKYVAGARGERAEQAELRRG